MKGPCEEFADRIVDYVDGELPEAEVETVARHLAQCEHCRRTAQALERSLGLAKVIWSDNLGDGESVAQCAFVQKRHHIRFYAVAASILVAGSLLFTISHQRSPSSIRLDEVERQVAGVATAARLLAATQILAQCEGTESIVEEQCRYILSKYADTPAAAMLRNSNPFRRNSP